VEYVIDYNLLYQLTTSIVEMGIIASPYVDFQWVADYMLWDRMDKNQDSYSSDVPVYFNIDTGRAFLDQLSDMNKATSELIVEVGTERRPIAKRYWRYIDGNTIQLNISQIVPGQYYLRYNQQRVYNRSRLNITFEHRSATTVPLLLVASWVEVDKNQVIDVSGGLQYHQLRLSVSGARSVGFSGDFRIRSLTLKGLRLHGVGASVPGLTDNWSVW